MAKIDIVRDRYKLVKHFFNKVYGIDFDSFYTVKKISDINMEYEAREFMKFVQLLHFADSTGGPVSMHKIEQFKDVLFTKRIEYGDELNAISTMDKVSSNDANRAIGLHFLLQYCEKLYIEYCKFVRDKDNVTFESHFLPPKTDYIKKIEANAEYHHNQMISWLNDFDPLKYTDDEDADVHLEIDTRLVKGSAPMDPFGSDNEMEEE